MFPPKKMKSNNGWKNISHLNETKRHVPSIHQLWYESSHWQMKSHWYLVQKCFIGKKPKQQVTVPKNLQNNFLSAQINRKVTTQVKQSFGLFCNGNSTSLWKWEFVELLRLGKICHKLGKSSSYGKKLT